MKRKLFLQWCLTNLLTVVVAFLALTLGHEQAANLNAVGKVMTGAIVAIYLSRCFWRVRTGDAIVSGPVMLTGSYSYHSFPCVARSVSELPMITRSLRTPEMCGRPCKIDFSVLSALPFNLQVHHSSCVKVRVEVIAATFPIFGTLNVDDL